MAPMDGVGATSLWVAAVRALESERADAWFHDPFARALAGERGFEILAQSRAMNPIAPPVLEARTRWIDEHIASASLDQIAILAAGMDARAYRLDALVGARVYEIDRDFVLAHKRETIGDAKTKAERVEVAIDLRDDWPAALARAGFDASRPTLFIVEGLLPYLEAAHVETLFARLDALAAPKSVALFDVNGRSALESPYMKGTLDLVKSLGAPWLFGTDEPESLLPATWTFDVELYGTVGAAYGRWPFPPIARNTPGVPQSFLVRATKR
jgi:methyltransferase (TIGR00027 family)